MQLAKAQIIELILIAAPIGVAVWYATQTKRQADLLSEQRLTPIKPLPLIDTAQVMNSRLGIKARTKENGSILHPTLDLSKCADMGARGYLAEKPYQLGQDNYRWESNNELLFFESNYLDHLLAPKVNNGSKTMC